MKHQLISTKDLILKNKITSMICDIKYNIYQYIEQFFYISSVQALTFSLIKQLNGSINGQRRYNINNIVNNFMRLQELLYDITSDTFNLTKIRESKIFAHFVLTSNSSRNDCFVMNYSNILQIDIIFKIILDTLIESKDYLSEKEIYLIIINNRIKIKYKGNKLKNNEDETDE